MRKNFPITNIETKVRDDQYLISITDLKGRLTYANPAFVEISGFEREELIGKAHNIIRHPDMPPEAFADLWETLKAHKPWLGMVKNRRKDGGFYWVLANAYPLFENGEVTSYASVRVQASEEQIRGAQAFYDDVNAGQAGGYTVKQGQRVRRGWRRLVDVAALPFQNTLRMRMLKMMMLAIGSIGVASYLAATGGVPPESQGLFWAAIGLATTASAWYGWRIATRVHHSLENIARVARQIAAGNLTIELESDADPDIRKLNFYLDIMRKGLIGISDDVQAGVAATGHASQVLYANNANLSARTEEQASSLQETAAAMEELTVTVKQNADNAHLANKLADNSMQIARRGGAVVSEVVDTMHGIHSSSSKIGDIVSMIEGIAFQTNILALNAAVESARAGEAGKSFAVVAGEVRNLSLKSSQAAKEIKVLIDESVARIATGSEQAERAGATMQQIVDSVTKVTDIMAEISTASVEQSSGLEQINQAIGQMDRVTHENGALVQDLGQTVRNLSAEAENLSDAIGVLKTGKLHTAKPAFLNSSAFGSASAPANDRGRQAPPSRHTNPATSLNAAPGKQALASS